MPRLVETAPVFDECDGGCIRSIGGKDGAEAVGEACFSGAFFAGQAKDARRFLERTLFIRVRRVCGVEVPESAAVAVGGAAAGKEEVHPVGRPVEGGAGARRDQLLGAVGKGEGVEAGPAVVAAGIGEVGEPFAIGGPAGIEVEVALGRGRPPRRPGPPRFGPPACGSALLRRRPNACGVPGRRCRGPSEPRLQRSVRHQVVMFL